MDAKVAVRDIMGKQGVGTNALAGRLGKPPRLVSDRLSKEKGKSLNLDKLTEILRALDYKVVLVPRETRTGEGWYEVE